MKRHGKIARLPRLIREELNARLAEGEEGDSLLSWLHRLPAVWTVLERDFAGARITKQNLSEWRQGGYAEWETRLEVLEEARELAGDGEDLRLLTRGRLADAEWKQKYHF